MAGNFADLTAILTLDSTRFSEEMGRVKKELGETSSLADTMSGKVSQSLNKSAEVIEQSLSRQALAAQKAGISVGQYKAAMRMLPAQFTDVATQLAGGQSPWLIMLQQGGQVKDSFGGIIPMFRSLAGAVTLPMAGVTSLAVATGALAYAWYQGDKVLSEFNKTLVLSGNQSGLTADRMLTLSRAGQAAGLTFNQASESLAALVNAGVRGGEQFDAINQSVARFASASGVEVDKVAEAFGKLTTDPTSGLIAMARQFRNVTAEQIAYVAQLQRSGDEAGALQAANEAATKGFDDQTRRLKENMGTLETWADRTARAFKSMWDAVLDIGRPDTAQEMLIKAEAAFKKADDIWNLRKDDYFVNDEARARYWDDREKARLALEAARKKAEQQSQQDKNAQQQSDTEASRLKYTEEAQKAYERLQTPLEKYTARQEELNKALKAGKILQADYNTLMAAAKKDYESTLKKPKQSGVKVSAGDRQEDNTRTALLALQTELRTLQAHAGANEKISQQRRELWKAESQYAVLAEAAQRRQLSAQEKSLLAHKDETLEYRRQLADLGDKVEYQKRLNELADQAEKFAQQQRAKQAAISAKGRGLTDRQAQRESEEQRLREVYGDNPQALAKATGALKQTWASEDQLNGSWMAGLQSGWSQWAESAMDSFSQVKSVSMQTFDGIAQNMAAMLTGSEQNWRSFTRSVLSMMTEILLKQAMVGIVGSIGSAIGGAFGGGASASTGTAIQAAAANFHFATGGFTGTGGKYEPAGIVHRGEFVFTKEATSRIGVGNLYRLMRGYATGGYVGGTGSTAQMRRAEGINFNQNNHVVIQNDGTNGLPGPQMMKAVYDMARKGARDEIQAQMRDGGVFSGGGGR
ncbi:phage tail tape measure protein [Escherichia coli]|uniref:phage tail tape measure protein n=1 Tax=Escherichia coli TaxID=562 RepID=UPI000BDF2AD6|nr:phage tail tape measure protein [Escherichia coli]MBB7674159.1 phage tail tape measure protein [Escherichia coli]MBB7701477.1 phage tail tape measure protein [Escherichia coli]